MVEFTVFKGSKDGKIVKGTTTKEIGQGKVLVEVTHSGLCYTDLHYMHGDMALGHEGTGIVKEVGPGCKLLKVGDRVGWGYEHSACGHCKQCSTGYETLCPEREMYGYANFDQGSMASHTVWTEHFLFKIPESLESEYAAPLMCGGGTVYNALIQGGVKHTDVVAIVGIGGLGHLAIQYAEKMGCEVIVISGTQNKRDEALALGAKQFFATKGVEDFSKLGIPQIDHLLVCTSAQPDWSKFLPLLAPRGTIYPLSVSEGDLKMPYMPLIAGALRIQGVLVPARQVHVDMLEFSARHGIKPIIQKFPLNVEGIETAIKQLNDGGMRYRGVLVADKQ